MILQDSVAYVPPLLQFADNEILYLEAWRGQNAIGSRIAITVSTLLQVSLRWDCVALVMY